MTDKGDRLTLGITYYAILVVHVESWWMELHNAQFNLGQGLGETVHCVVSVAKMGDWLLELYSAQLELAQDKLYAIPGAKGEALSS